MTLLSCNKDDVIETEPELPDSTDVSELPDPAERTMRVIEYTPAPGQFINDPTTMGTLTSPEAAAAWAESRLSEGRYVSLGAFGGYIVVGFSLPIEAGSNDTYDFTITGNAFVSAQGGSNEPGIVWVMADSNGNGLPDDTWYELAGSEPAPRRNHSVTYRRPSEPGSPVQWTASDGTSGEVKYIPFVHTQPTYYPEWIAADEYTLTGTLLPAKTTYDPDSHLWSNPPFDWGYADNYGSDTEGETTRFKISNAIKSDGSAANLSAIDFIKVQSGVMAQAGVLGEVSTEVCAIAALTE